MEYFGLMVLAAIAIENLSDIIVTVPWFVGPREWFKETFPSVARLADCKYCQCWWLSALVALNFPEIGVLGQPLTWLLVALCLHRMAQFVDGAYERFLRVLEPEPEQAKDEPESEMP